MVENGMASRPAGHDSRTLLLCTALIAGGLAGNYFNFTIFLNIDFIFGSIFTMLALQMIGPGPAVLTAVIVSSYTFILWNHPYAILIMTAEAAVVGLITKHRKPGLVLADTLYWLFLGIPLVFVFYHVVMHTPVTNTWIVAVKQALNGITNTLIARMIFIACALGKRSRLISYRDIFYNLLAFFVLCPALLLVSIDSRTDYQETDRRIRTALMHDIQLTDLILENWATNRTVTIHHLARMAETRSPQEMQPYLEMAQKTDPNFLRIGLMDRSADCVAAYPLTDELGQQNIGKNFADRPFIPALRKTLKPMLSEVFMGRIGRPRPVIATFAPVVIHGEYGGYIAGVLNLEQMRSILDTGHLDDATRYILLDKYDKVIFTNRTDQAMMTPFNREKGSLHPLDGMIRQWVPDIPSNTPTMDRWKQSYYIVESGIGPMNEWRLILEQPVAPFQKALYGEYTRKLILLFLLLIFTLLLAEFLSIRLMRTLEKLYRISRNLPDRLLKDHQNVEWPETNILETNRLIHNFKQMSASLITLFNEIREINKSLEQQVALEVEKSVMQERMLIRQSRMAAMGEMIGNIAHQWRQPLNALGLLLFNIKDTYQFGTLDAKFLDQAIADGNRLVRKMSTTISDFSNFFRPDKKIAAFSARQQIRDAVNLVASSFQNHHLAIRVDAPTDLKLLGFPNEYSQVLLNLLSNAKDAILSRQGPESGKVEIQLSEQNGQGCVHVRDNGGGISEDILDRIFDPYFSTKEKGSGIGLYMSQMIIENNMHGSITAKNIPEGAEFTVSLPLATNVP